MATEEIMKTALSALPGLFGCIGPRPSPRLSPWATFLRPPRRAPEPNRAYSSAYAPFGRGLSTRVWLAAETWVATTLDSMSRLAQGEALRGVEPG